MGSAFTVLSKTLHIDEIMKHLDLPWSLLMLCENKTLTVEILFKFLEHKNYSISDIPKHYWDTFSENVSMEDVKKYPNLPWNCIYMSYNKNITVEVIRLLGLDKNWCWDKLTRYVHINEIMDNKDLPWYRNNLGYNRTVDLNGSKWKSYDYSALSEWVDISIIESNPDLPWKITDLNRNPSITLEYILSNIGNGNWSMYYISNVISMDEIKKDTTNYPWQLYELSSNPRLTLEVIMLLGHTNDEWDWDSITRNISLDVIKKNPDLPWDIRSFIYNKDITLRDMYLISCKGIGIFKRLMEPLKIVRTRLHDITITTY